MASFLPNDPYASLPRERQEIFGEIRGTAYIPADELPQVKAEWALGFGFKAAEYDRMGINPETVSSLRDKFFNYMGLEWEDFPWADWREAMGYNE